ncbi:MULTISPECIES: UDP-2,4-diacetamido-2,4,6-trideoxy-beta-L-altropyranose hydrolase [Marinomonas]|uniref:UDP-2,4-diacetamido-2,4, 6-trideoxy-beta-L-altropyranose hydrolase n=1 Tax=Marinomonas rhodophyticola TaxID=2992803 RepID=A0ABT3KFF1_9GAMM|nr:UDP-2,4-diacetamido-2,4,6-trideoxy-beta-L-altropyranose hydrolase [Marinomonas sp. KJ51-3]MCW4629255.1 UDP-2,4-diacetamido-2,4,6-trideoxy-beta-L-altropyranose hydrolase [Marinomonas sp. KJ51-3]
MKLLVRADASVEIGMGHRVRSQALIHAFHALGWQCQFAVAQRHASFASPDDILIEDEVAFLAVAQQADLVILDHYGYSAADIRRLYQHQPNLLVLDDMNDRGDFPARWLLNPLEQNYSTLVEKPLTGSQYALLRPAFQQSSIDQPRTKRADKLLITLGGTDPLALTLPIVQSLLTAGFAIDNLQVLLGANAKQADQVEAFCAAHQIAVERGVSDVTPLMKRAKMAISAAGGTLFELACMGVPTVFAQVADNQTRSLEQHIPLGWCRAVRFDNQPIALHSALVEQLVSELRSLWLNDAWQVQARATAKSLVDGLGAQRVAQVITDDLSRLGKLESHDLR